MILLDELLKSGFDGCPPARVLVESRGPSLLKERLGLVVEHAFGIFMISPESLKNLTSDTVQMKSQVRAPDVEVRADR